MKKIIPRFFLLLLPLVGCAGLRAKFKEGRSVNYAPFADQTVTLLSSLNYELSPNEVFLMRPYADLNSPEIKRLNGNVQLEREFLKGIMSYSIEIVNLSESGAPPADQVKEYANYLSGLINAVATSENSTFSLKKEDVDKTISIIASKPILLEAMQQAKPFILEFNQINLRLIQSIADDRRTIVKSVQDNIDLKFRDFVKLDLELRKQKAELARRLSSPKLTASAQKSLTDQMIAIKNRQEIIQPDLDTYRELKMKMDSIAEQHDQMIRSGGRAILLWCQAHQKMANGMTNPAEWISMGDMKNAIVGAGKKVVP